MVYVLLEQPGQDENDKGVPLNSKNMGQTIRRVMAESWPGKAVIDNAVRCYGRGQPEDDVIRTCGTYTLHTLEVYRPERIIALGTRAAQQVLDEPPPMHDLDRAVGFWGKTPVFCVKMPNRLVHNPYLRRQWKEDFRWALTEDPREHRMAQPHLADCHWVQTREDAKEAAEVLADEPYICFDLEWAGLPYMPDFEVVTIALTGPGLDSPYVVDREQIQTPGLMEPILELLKDHPVGNHNIKSDLVAFRAQWGFFPENVVWDTLLERKIQNAEAHGGLDVAQWEVAHGRGKREAKAAIADTLKRCRRRPSKSRPVTETELNAIGPRKWVDQVRAAGEASDGKTWVYGLIDSEVRVPYAAMDTRSTVFLHMEQERRRREMTEERRAAAELVWSEILGPAIPAFAQLETWGMAVSRRAIRDFQVRMQARVEAIRKRLSQYDCDFNSRPQLAKLLFEDLGLPVIARTPKGQPKTSEAVLKKLSGKHPIVDDLLAYGKWNKALTAFAYPLMEHVRADDRIHAQFRIDGARTGRLSCVQPNLQQIGSVDDPGKDTYEDSKLARDCFVAPPGRVLIQLDYSQQELRVAAALSGDKAMARIFIQGIDFHKGTAATAFNVPLEEVTKNQRGDAKNVNFGLLYGQGDAALAAKIGCTKEHAASVRKAVLGGFPDLAKTMNRWVREAKRDGGTWTYWEMKKARWRPLPDLGHPDGGFQSSAVNGAKNCLDGKTEALTKRGWVPGFELTMEDEILTKNPHSGALEWERPTDLCFWPGYEGEFVEFRSKSFHAVTTPEHRWLVTSKHSGRWEQRTSATLSVHGDHRIHRTGEYAAPEVEAVADDFVRLAGWFLTDGYKIKTRRVDRPGLRGPKPGTPRSGLCQVKEQHVASIRELVGRLSSGGQIEGLRETRDAHGCWRWEFKGLASDWLWKEFPDRVLTFEFLSQLSGRQLGLLRTTMLDGDGHQEAGGKVSFYSGSQAQADAFQALVTLTGGHARRFWRDMAKYEPQSEKLSNIPKSDGYWVVTISKRDTVQVQKSQKTTYRAKGGVWCPVVPNTFFVARRGEHVWITGNTPIQGTASDYMLVSVARIVRRIQREKRDWKVVVTVHDSVILEVPEGEALAARQAAEEEMLRYNTNRVPLKVDAEIGRSWGSLEAM